MKKSYVFSIVLTYVSLALFPQLTLSQDGEEIQSLRGDLALEENSQEPTWKRTQPDRDPLQRNYVHQPPLIPHDIEKYRITIKFNKCLSCHSWANYKKAKATKMSSTHFKDRDGNFLANIAPRHYFCTQCHVSQSDAEPLVDNAFEPVKVLQW
jgi:nitrate reductase (cytochrome), electron transfer subunit